MKWRILERSDYDSSSVKLWFLEGTRRAIVKQRNKFSIRHNTNSSLPWSKETVVAGPFKTLKEAKIVFLLTL